MELNSSLASNAGKIILKEMPETNHVQSCGAWSSCQYCLRSDSCNSKTLHLHYL